MLASVKISTSRKGQAIMELLPSMIIFLMIMTGALSYYRVMRSATIKQEIIRNLMFAKINNSGTLTTTTNQVKPGSSDLSIAASINSIEATNSISQANNGRVLRDSSCFAVLPDKPSETMTLGPLFMAGELGELNFKTFAVIYRNTDKTCP